MGGPTDWRIIEQSETITANNGSHKSSFKLWFRWALNLKKIYNKMQKIAIHKVDVLIKLYKKIETFGNTCIKCKDKVLERDLRYKK